MSKAEIVPLVVDRSRLENTSDFTSWLRKLLIYDRKDIAEAFLSPKISCVLSSDWSDLFVQPGTSWEDREKPENR